MQTFLVTGFSEDSMDDAIAKAMAQVSSFVSADKDVNISIVSTTEKDDGYEAVLKVIVIPMSDKAAFKREGQDQELLKLSEKEYKRFMKAEETERRRRVEEYLLQMHGSTIADLPELDLNNFDIEALYEGAFEEAFDHAAHLGGEHEKERVKKALEEQFEEAGEPEEESEPDHPHRKRKKRDDMELEPH